MYNNDSLDTPTSNDYYTTNAFTDSLISFIDEQQDSEPFFSYLAFNAPHWPLHALKEDIMKFMGNYKIGWDTLRVRRWKRQLELGIVDKKWGLSPRDTVLDPFIAEWPKGITSERNKYYREPAHIIDIMTTLVELSGAKYPVDYKGNKIHPMEGVSLVPVFKNGYKEAHDWLFWEHRLEGAARHGDYKAIFRENTNKWSLYNIADDRTETNDLSEQMPEKLKNMKKRWLEWAETHDVLPKKGIKLEKME